MSLYWIEITLVPDTRYPQNRYWGYWPVPSPATCETLFNLAGLMTRSMVGWMIALDADSMVAGCWSFSGKLFQTKDDMADTLLWERFRRYPPDDPFQFYSDRQGRQKGDPGYGQG